MNRVGQVLCIADNNLNSSSNANLTGTTSGDGAVLVAEWSPSAEQHFTYASGLSNDVKQAAINTGIVEELYSSYKRVQVRISLHLGEYLMASGTLRRLMV